MVKPILYALVVVSMLLAPAARPEKKVILPPGAKPSGNWSYGILADGTLYVSGMGGEDANGKIPATFEAEVQQSLENLDRVLKAAEMSSANTVRAEVYTTTGETFSRMNKVYNSHTQERSTT